MSAFDPKQTLGELNGYASNAHVPVGVTGEVVDAWLDGSSGHTVFQTIYAVGDPAHDQKIGSHESTEAFEATPLCFDP